MYEQERIAYIMYQLWGTASTHKNLLICELFNDSAKRSDCLMSNMWLRSEELKGEELRLATNQKAQISISEFVIGNFH